MSRFRRKKADSSSKYHHDDDDSTMKNKKQKTIDFGGGKVTKKRRNNNNNNNNNNKNNDRKKIIIDDDDPIIDSDQEEEEEDDDDDDDDLVEEEETLDAKKIRLAREYLRKLEQNDQKNDDDDSSTSESNNNNNNNDDDDEDEDSVSKVHDRIGMKLQRERLKREGTYQRIVADKVKANIQSIVQTLPTTQMMVDPSSSLSAAACQLRTSSSYHEAKQWIDMGYIRLLSGHDLTPTCVALQSNGERATSGSKDHSVIIWDIQKEQRALVLCPSWKKQQQQQQQQDDIHHATSRTKRQVLSVACSDDGHYAAVGRRDGTVCIYDIRVNNQTKSSSSESFIKTFTGHKGPITSLCFRTQSLQLFSASEDRCIRHYNLNEMMYLETLFGHQFGVTDIDCHQKERPISVGRDRTARAWKIADDTHLVFRGGGKMASPDCIRIIKEDWFLTGHQDGHLALWMTEKKHPIVSIDFAHGAVGNVPRGITALGSLRGSDLAVSGSYDGYLRWWKLCMGQTRDTRGMQPLEETIPLHGHVNSIAIGPKARFCVVAVGQEPKMGRWNRVAGAKNRFGIIHMRSKEDNIMVDHDNALVVDNLTVPRGQQSSNEESERSDSDE
jgi:ribosomal RNA-processing protein 9